MIETHRSFTNRWECDENSHMNVQFYVKRFDEAFEAFHALMSASDAGSKALQLAVRHIRYHRELHEGDSARIESGMDESGALIHIMRETRGGQICTTARDILKHGAHKDAPEASREAREAAGPRGLVIGPVEASDAMKLLDAGQAITSNYSVVEDRETSASGVMKTNRIVSRFTDGAPHIWDNTGVTTDWLQENNFGRVAVEMKVMPVGAVKPGEVLRLISWVPDRSARTFRVAHQLTSLTNGNVIARGEVCCLVMDLSARRAVSLPDSLATLAG